VRKPFEISKLLHWTAVGKVGMDYLTYKQILP